MRNGPIEDVEHSLQVLPPPETCHTTEDIREEQLDEPGWWLGIWINIGQPNGS